MARSPVPSVPTRLIDVEVADRARRGAPVAVLVAEGDDAAHVEVPAGVGFSGKAGQVQILPDKDGPRWVVGVGAGTPRHYREAGAAFVRAAHAYADTEADSGGRPPVTVQVRPPEQAGAGEYAAFTTGAILGGYRYRVTGSDEPARVRRLRLVAPEGSVDECAAAVARAGELARATALARDLANTPSNVKNPAWLADTAQRIADVPGLSVTVRDDEWLAQQRFGGMLAVGGGSAHPPRLIELSYRPRGAAAHLLLVGKGITFDTGGISVKPAAGMHLMRTDMSGGGAVVAAMRAIATLKPRVRVTALVPAAENAISGSAYRPGDVVRHYGGRTTQIDNTDAEGRMVLADALAYGIATFRPDVVVDVATLTGAMKVALGLRTGGLFATDDELADRLLTAGAEVGEQWWRMPLSDEYADAIRSEIADVRQGPPGPGGISAALFLREFTAGLPWAHLDIAGPARAESTYAEVVPGGTGFAARTLVQFVASYA
ncbi:leucyl aminopeptidase family protein [Saccharomonospora viridis]|uniref:Probable cytosol aminopeptidase n=1 Tax=Saccharomonospora viridis TaxID=1852 RepID=A0A837D801_9PSEU|nr:leucyl aminopeptidase family protein [Saccharomonospora viridis]KHF43923.1 peptidase M17 [Saccharomonospora viridis]SFP88725.1 leucyl aminopeptidase [Saccharomonospora viridis]